MVYLMLAFVFVLVSSGTIDSFDRIPMSDPSVKSIQRYLTKVLPLLFPGARGMPEIESAESQVGHANKFRLRVRAPRDLDLTIVVSVNSLQQPKIISISPGMVEQNLMGGYRWRDLSSLDDETINGIKTALKEQKGFTGEMATILAVRIQIVAGQNRHLIFTDETGKLWSTVIYTNIAGEHEVTYYQKGE